MASNGNGNSLVKWAMSLVLAAIVALAAMGFMDNRNAVVQNALDIRDLRAGDGKYETRIALLEDHYSTIREQNAEILAELHKLLNERGRRSGVDTGHSSRPSNADVLNGNP